GPSRSGLHGREKHHSGVPFHRAPGGALARPGGRARPAPGRRDRGRRHVGGPGGQAGDDDESDRRPLGGAGGPWARRHSRHFGRRLAARTARQAEAVVVRPPTVHYVNRTRIIALAISHRLPSMFWRRDFVDAGGLMSYGSDQPEMYRRAASLVSKILQGAKPGDLPVEQPRKFELIVNLKTAKALGLTIPQPVLLLADEVIQ